MIRDLFLAFNDVFSNKIKGLVLITVLITFAVSAGVFFGFAAAADVFLRFDQAWVQRLVEIVGYFGIFILCLMLFPVIASLVAGFLIDSGLEKLSDRPLRAVPLRESLKMSGVAAFQSLVSSVFLVPLTLLLAWIPLLNFIPAGLYYWVNGRVLGREYFFAVASRSLDYDKAADLFEKNRFYWTKAGIVIAFLMTIPLLNMVSPLVAAAFMRRLFLKKVES